MSSRPLVKLPRLPQILTLRLPHNSPSGSNALRLRHYRLRGLPSYGVLFHASCGVTMDLASPALREHRLMREIGAKAVVAPSKSLPTL